MACREKHTTSADGLSDEQTACAQRLGEAGRIESILKMYEYSSSVYTHLDWHTIRQQWRDLTLTDSRFVHYHTTLVSISISKQSQVSENQKAVEQQCREEKIKYVTVITKHHILGLWWHNKQAHWGKDSKKDIITALQLLYFTVWVRRNKLTGLNQCDRVNDCFFSSKLRLRSSWASGAPGDS